MAKKIFGAYVGNLSEVPGLENLAERVLNGRRFKGTEGRGNVVMARLSDDALGRIDQLVEATVFQSRSEAMAFLVGAGIQSQKEMFDRLSSHTDEIRKLKEQLRKVALDALHPDGAKPDAPPAEK
jgi:Arc/MetJ-type ribon-helix-helix transcriptional regulator